jgi:hypothetical protein
MDAESKASLQATCCGKLGHFVSKHDVCESKCYDCNETGSVILNFSKVVENKKARLSVRSKHLSNPTLAVLFSYSILIVQKFFLKINFL